MSQLLPDGITHLADCPHTLHHAILTALRLLGYEEKLVSEERPPKHIWLDFAKLEEWFEKVERERKDKYGIPNDAESGDYEENAAAEGLITRG